MVVVAGVVVVALPSIAFTASFTRPVDVFGVAPAPAPVKIKIFTVLMIKYLAIYSLLVSLQNILHKFRIYGLQLVAGSTN